MGNAQVRSACERSVVLCGRNRNEHALKTEGSGLVAVLGSQRLVATDDAHELTHAAHAFFG